MSSPILRFARTSLTRYSPWFALGIGFLYATNWIAVHIPLEIKRGVDWLLAPNRNPDEISSVALSILGLGLLLFAVRTASRLFFFTPGRYIERDLREHLFSHLLTLDSAYYAKHPPGEVLSKLINDLGSVRALAGFATLQIANVAIGLGLALNQMLRIDAPLAMSAFIPLIVAFLSMQGGIRRLFGMVQQNQTELASLSQHVLGSYNGISVLRAFTAENFFLSRFDRDNARYVKSALTLNAWRTAFMALLPFTGSLGIFILLFYGGHRVAIGAITVGELAALMGLIAVTLPLLTSFGWLLAVIQRGLSALNRLYTILDSTPYTSPFWTEGGSPFQSTFPPRESGGTGGEYSEKGSPPPSKMQVELSPPLLQLHHLSFTYPETPSPVLKDLSLSLRTGEVLGVFGPTGAGKSTLLSLIARIYEASPGQIFLNGEDISTIPLTDYRALISLVPQSPFLFSATIAENIALGRQAPLSRNALDHLIALAELSADLSAFPEGLETRVGPRGIALSGGQRQRIALARALASPAPILLLDDVLSAVDHATEARLIDHLYAEGRTMILVSHRLSALRRANRIAIVEGGTLSALETHESLIATHPLYGETAALQDLAAPFQNGGISR